MRLFIRISALWLLVVTTNAWAATVASNFPGMDYREFNSCYFNNHHAFTQQLNTVIKQQARLGKGVVFDEPVVVGFSARKPSNNGFYVDYEQSDCTPNFETMQSTCTIKVTGFKYGAVPGIYNKIYLDTLRSQVDSTLLSEFVAALVRGLDDNVYGVAIEGLGTFTYDSKKAAVVFESIPLDQFDIPVTEPGALSLLDCNRNDLVDVSVAVVGSGSVAVTSNTQLMDQSVVNGVKHYYYPSYSQITLSATAAAGYHFHDFSCNGSGVSTLELHSTINPTLVGSTVGKVGCEALFMEDAPVVPTIGNSVTNVRLISAAGKFAKYSYSIAGFDAGVSVELNTYVSPRKLRAYLFTQFCWQLAYYDHDGTQCGDDGNQMFGQSFSSPVVNDVILGHEYTMTLRGVTVKFVVDGWANDSSRKIDLRYLGYE
jgi:hypothetical protein